MTFHHVRCFFWCLPLLASVHCSQTGDVASCSADGTSATNTASLLQRDTHKSAAHETVEEELTDEGTVEEQPTSCETQATKRIEDMVKVVKKAGKWNVKNVAPVLQAFHAWSDASKPKGTLEKELQQCRPKISAQKIRGTRMGLTSHGSVAYKYNKDGICWRATWPGKLQGITRRAAGTRGKSCGLSTERGVPTNTNCGGVECVKGLMDGSLNACFCKNWKGKSTLRPAILVPNDRANLASVYQSEANRPHTTKDDDGIYALKLGYVLVWVQDASGRACESKMTKALVWTSQGKLTESLEKHGRIKINADRLGLWGFSATASCVTGISNKRGSAARADTTMLKAVVAMGQAAWPPRSYTNHPPWFLMYCREGPFKQKTPYTKSFAKLQKLKISFVSFSWFNCNHGQYNENDVEWFPQIQEYFLETLGRPR